MKKKLLYKSLLGLGVLLVFIFGLVGSVRNAQAGNHCERDQLGQVYCWYHLIVQADPANLCIENKFLIGIEPNGYTEGFCPESPEPTEEPTVSPEPTSQPEETTSPAPLSCPNDQHLDASGTKCVSFEYGGPSTGDAGGVVLGTSTEGQVLGLSSTSSGSVSPYLFWLGIISFTFGLRLITLETVNVKSRFL